MKQRSQIVVFLVAAMSVAVTRLLRWGELALEVYECIEQLVDAAGNREK